MLFYFSGNFSYTGKKPGNSFGLFSFYNDVYNYELVSCYMQKQ